MELDIEILRKHEKLGCHPLYEKLDSISHLQIFMKYHAFAVWDFMSLLKSLQRSLTSVTLPWVESTYSSELVRLINEIVLAEESDLDFEGNPTSHFALYLKAMDEIGADTTLIKNFVVNRDYQVLPSPIQKMLHYHLNLALGGETHEVAASFFYGREKLIPTLFSSILNAISSAKLTCPALIYYLERHIDLDAHDHGPKALKCLNRLLDSPQKKRQANSVALGSLDMREELWNFIASEIKSIS